MAAFNMNQGRSAVQERHDEMSERGDTAYPRARTVTFHGRNTETVEQRRARLTAEAARFHVSSRCFRV